MKFKKFLFIIGLFLFAFPLIARADAPDKPNLNYLVTSTSITLNWDAVDGATQYDVCFRGDDFASSIVTGINTIYEDLIPNTDYYIKVRACDAGADLSSSDCSTDIEGCSGFTTQKKIKTSKDISVEDLKLSYEELNLRYQATLTKYLDYVAIDNRKELTELDSGTKVDFAGEVNTLKSELQNDLASVKGLQDKSAIETKYNDLKGSFANKFNILKYKLKAYKKLNGYYKKLEGYKNSFSGGDFKKDIFGTYIDKAKIYYRNYEDQVKDIVVDGTGDNYNNIKAKYKEIGAELQYRFSGLIYKKLRYLKRVKEKLERYQDKVNSYDELLPATRTEYGNIIAAAKSNYENYVDLNNWIIKSFPPNSISIDNMKDKYNVVNDDYKNMKRLGDYKKAIYIVKGLKRINSIFKYVEEKNGKTQGFSGDSLVPVLQNSLINIKSKSGVYKEDIFSALRAKEAEIITSNNPKEIYKQIRGYKSYKVFSYYTKGAESWYKLATKISSLKSVVDTIDGGCPNAVNKITEAIDYAENAKNQLLDYELGDYDSIRRIHYPQFKKEYREANSKYKEAIREAKNCL